ncbi:MAG TPA: NADH-quinone oxidoreductase subunit M [Alphaproteobacteria bacterium]|nr:NADH-quinone oxidoreductase subunit M [Rhodospirillaceae bacterium]HRJ67070.1 NADH-quinone oxidoreductase subunit M [Alphaproteobacteria bacterium]
MITFPILSLVTFLPLVGVLFLLFIRGNDETVARNARATALLTSIFTFALSLYMYAHFDKTSSEFQFVEQMSWLPGLDINYKMGIDGISVFFVLLSAFLTPICILASWESITSRVKEYMISFLLLETMMIGMFCALDLVLFYVFFEAVLIPMFVIIGVWGGSRRVYASFKFFLYTLLGSVLMLIAILALYRTFNTTDIILLTQVGVPEMMQKWIWLAFLASFAVKVPMWPVHTWLPDAHVEAPTAGSVILAGVLLKMGGYGFLRLSLPILPEASAYFTPMIFTLSVIAVVYTSLVALVQEDMKKLIAYSSVAHMGFVTLGIFTFNQQGLEGAMFQMLSHGVVSAALFLCVGVVYDRLHTREITRYGGLVKNMPRYAAVFMLFTMASVGLPGTSGFVGEFLVLAGMWQASTVFTFIAATGVVLGAAYMLFLYRRVVFGELNKPDVKAMKDINLRELSIFAPLVVLVLWMGIYPSSVIAPMAPSLTRVLDQYHARVTHKTAMTPAIQKTAAPTENTAGEGEAQQ